MSLRAILLDIDGTLVDSNDAHAAAWSEASAEFGYDRPASFFRPLIGMGGDHVLPKIDEALDEDENPGKAIAARRVRSFPRSTYRQSPQRRARKRSSNI